MSGCHAGSSPAEDLNLQAGNTYGSTVGVAAFQSCGGTLVVAGNADASYLVSKLEGTQCSGQRMPRGGPSLSAQQIADVRAWITAGAPNN